LAAAPVGKDAPAAALYCRNKFRYHTERSSKKAHTTQGQSSSYLAPRSIGAQGRRESWLWESAMSIAFARARIQRLTVLRSAHNRINQVGSIPRGPTFFQKETSASLPLPSVLELDPVSTSCGRRDRAKISASASPLKFAEPVPIRRCAQRNFLPSLGRCAALSWPRCFSASVRSTGR